MSADFAITRIDGSTLHLHGDHQPALHAQHVRRDRDATRWSAPTATR